MSEFLLSESHVFLNYESFELEVYLEHYVIYPKKSDAITVTLEVQSEIKKAQEFLQTFL